MQEYLDSLEPKFLAKTLRTITYNPVTNDYVALGAIVGKAFSDGMQLK